MLILRQALCNIVVKIHARENDDRKLFFGLRGYAELSVGASSTHVLQHLIAVYLWHHYVYNGQVESLGRVLNSLYLL